MKLYLYVLEQNIGHITPVVASLGLQPGQGGLGIYHMD